MTELALFVAGLFALPWAIKAVLPPPSGTLASFLVSFVPSVWTPTLLALVFVAARGGSAGVRTELRARLRYTRAAGRLIVLAAVAPIVVVAVAILVGRATGNGAPFIEANSLVQAILLQIITGAAGEELGWRGFLLPRLARVSGTTAAVWIMGVLWSLWHVPAFFDRNLPHYFMPMIPVLLFVAGFGAFLGLMFFLAGESILVTMSAHLALNIMLAIGGASLTSRVFWTVLAIAFGTIPVSFTFFATSSTNQ